MASVTTRLSALAANADATNVAHYRTVDDGPEGFSKDELIELEAYAFHDGDRHTGRLATCKKGCWEAAAVEVDHFPTVFRPTTRP